VPSHRGADLVDQVGDPRRDTGAIAAAWMFENDRSIRLGERRDGRRYVRESSRRYESRTLADDEAEHLGLNTAPISSCTRKRPLRNEERRAEPSTPAAAARA